MYLGCNDSHLSDEILDSSILLRAMWSTSRVDDAFPARNLFSFNGFLNVEE